MTGGISGKNNDGDGRSCGEEVEVVEGRVVSGIGVVECCIYLSGLCKHFFLIKKGSSQEIIFPGKMISCAEPTKCDRHLKPLLVGKR